MIDFSERVRAGIRANVINEFDITEVPNLPMDWTASSQLVFRVPTLFKEPYVLFRSTSAYRVDPTKTEVSRDYVTTIEIVDRYETDLGDSRRADALANQVLSLVDRVRPTVAGANVYLQTADRINSFEFTEQNSRFFKIIINVTTRVEELEATGLEPGAGMLNQEPTFILSDFTFTPTNNRIELFDAGDITGALVYPNTPDFGFDNAVYSLAAGSDGVLTDGVVAVDGDDLVSINSILNYTSSDNPLVMQAVNSVTTFPRIRSFRQGVTTGSSITNVQDLVGFDAGRNEVRYGTVSPVGQFISWNLLAGERPYLMFDENEPDLVAIRQEGLEVQLITNFTQTTLDGFKIYILNIPFQLPNTLTVNIL